MASVGSSATEGPRSSSWMSPSSPVLADETSEPNEDVRFDEDSTSMLGARRTRCLRSVAPPPSSFYASGQCQGRAPPRHSGMAPRYGSAAWLNHRQGPPPPYACHWTTHFLSVERRAVRLNTLVDRCCNRPPARRAASRRQSQSARHAGHALDGRARLVGVRVDPQLDLVHRARRVLHGGTVRRLAEDAKSRVG